MKDDLRDDDSAVSGLAFTIARNLRKNYWRDNSRLAFVDEIKDEDAYRTSLRAGLAIRKWIEKERLTAFTVNFTRSDDAGITTTVRRTLGSDIDASCGQLRKKYEQT